MADLFAQTSRKRWCSLAAILIAVYLAVRLPGLMALPIFGDEAIYIRWSQWVTRGEWFISPPGPPNPRSISGSWLPIHLALK